MLTDYYTGFSVVSNEGNQTKERLETSMPIDNTIYDRLAATWWDKDEAFSSLLTILNPGRFGYFREVLLEQEKIDPLGKKTLDIGCGGGLLAEEFARLGCQVTGVDPSEPSLVVARRHAEQQGLMIDYRQGVGEHLPFADASFDIVYCCDVLEHVTELRAVIAEIARVLKPEGFFFYDTINRTLVSKVITIKLLQEWRITRVLPPNLHDWQMFIPPRELSKLMMQKGLSPQAIVGLVPETNPLILLSLILRLRRGTMTLQEVASRIQLIRSKDTSNLYMGYAVKIFS